MDKNKLYNIVNKDYVTYRAIKFNTKNPKQIKL